MNGGQYDGIAPFVGTADPMDRLNVQAAFAFREKPGDGTRVEHL
jgi:hypothetical protein